MTRTMTAAHFARAVGVSVNKVHALMDAGEIRFVSSLCSPRKPDRRPVRYIPDFEVEEFLRRASQK